MRVLLGVLGLATVASVVWLSLQARRLDPVRTDALPGPEPVTRVLSVSPKASPIERPAPAGLGPAANSAREFRDRIRALVETGDLAPSERRTRAAALKASILERESSGDLMPAESAYLQLSLLRATESDGETLRARSSDLLQRYRDASEAGWEAYRNRTDPRAQVLSEPAN